MVLFYKYSNIWKLDINFSKTKIMIFGTRNDDRFQFKLGDNIISICQELKYFGIIFSKNRSFYAAMKHNSVQAKKSNVPSLQENTNFKYEYPE